MAESATVIGVDLGNTRLSVARVDEAGRLLQLWREPTPAAEGAPVILEHLTRLIRSALAAGPAAAVGVGFGGPVDLGTGMVRRSHHTSGWEDLPLREHLAAACGLPVYLDNDANAGGLGEALFGAGAHTESMLYINIGTGIGGAVILGQRIHHGAHSNAGEIGHVVITPDRGPLCTCGKRGCLETLASGRALGTLARTALQDDPGRDTVLRGVPLQQVTGADVSAAARVNDPLALEIIGQAGRYLGFAAAAACNVLDPDLVIVGGGVSEGSPEYLQAACQGLADYAAPPVAERTPLLPAALGYDAGVVGAGAVALQALGAV